MNAPKTQLQAQHYLGRQPILDLKQNIVAYELLFRSGQTATSGVTDDLLATSTVIINTISQFGIDHVLDKQDGFINVSYELLMSDMLELLPRERVVLELLETVKIDEQVIQRCRDLKAKGFRLALDDFEYAPVYDPLFDLVDIVKFDVMLSDAPTIEQALKIVKRWPHIQLLAEKVEDHAQYQRCQDWGFTLFQGYFFARPVVLSGKKTNPNHITLVRVIGQLSSDAEIADIERTFKESASLSLGLLRLVNSVGMGLNRKIGSLNQALVILGRRQLQRWVQLLLYAQNNSSANSPVMQMAAMRAKSMELLSQQHPDQHRRTEAAKDQAFMVGMLSLVDVVVGMEMEEVLGQLGLIDEVKNAVLKRDGFLGKLLSLVENVEIDNFAATSSLLAELQLTPAALNQAELEAMQWVASLAEEAHQ